MLRKGTVASAEDSISADEEVRDPLVLEFLGLKDEYSETDLEEALLRHLENFLLELGGDFAFIGRDIEGVRNPHSAIRNSPCRAVALAKADPPS
jgi:predicted nuclease of restriction endonuclease-like (RecB) superfamily